MFICDKCNGEYESLPNDVDSCPFCSGLLEEAKRCEKCGEYFVADFSENICKPCMHKLTTFDNVYKYIETLGDTADLQVNSFLHCACKAFHVDVNLVIYKHLKRFYTDNELNEIMKDTAMFMMRREGSDAEEFLLKEDEQ